MNSKKLDKILKDFEYKTKKQALDREAKELEKELACIFTGKYPKKEVVKNERVNY